MGCCQSFSSTLNPLEDHTTTDVSSEPRNNAGTTEDPPLTIFSFSDLTMATDDFSLENIVSDHASNFVYMGILQNGDFVAVKRFGYMSWPDPNKFVEEAERVGKLRHKRVVKLIGYCCDDDNNRLLVADFMPNDTLAKRLFQRKNQTMGWSTRLRVAYCVGEALEYCNSAGFGAFTDLSVYKILFDEDNDACLSCFGLVKEVIDDDDGATGSVNPEDVTYRFGTVLVNLLTGKQIPPSHAPEMIQGKSVTNLMDPCLKGRFFINEASLVLRLASQCLQYEDVQRPNTDAIVAVLETLQTKTEAPPHVTIEMINKSKSI